MVMHSLRATTVTYVSMGDFVTQWTLPKWLASYKFEPLFKTSIIQSNLRNQDFACGSSQLLCLVPILLMLFTEVATPQLTAWEDHHELHKKAYQAHPW